MLPYYRRLKSLNVFYSIEFIASLCNKYFSTVQMPTIITTNSKKKTIFSGIQPTGTIHIGNYLGAVSKWVEIQNNGDDCIFSIVDLHAITMPHDHLHFNKSIRTMVATLIACGIDPQKSILYQQSQVSEHASLSWVLGCMTTMPRLSGLAQFKEKSALFTNKSVPTGLFLYPVLQAADILLYKATHVPVGSDQIQNINLCIHLSNFFNNLYGITFPVPKAIIMDDSLAKIRSLKNPANKMSKSETNPLGKLDLLDSPEDIIKKIKKAMTDFISEVYYDPVNRPGVSNLMTIHSALTGKSYDDITKESSHVDTGKYKLLLGDIVVECLAPVRETTTKILNEKGYIENILKNGRDNAKERALKTMDEVYDKLGFKLM